MKIRLHAAHALVLNEIIIRMGLLGLKIGKGATTACRDKAPGNPSPGGKRTLDILSSAGCRTFPFYWPR